MANGNDPFLLRPGRISKTFAIRMSLSYTVVEYRLFPIFFDAKSDWHQPTRSINIIYYIDIPRPSKGMTFQPPGHPVLWWFLGHKFHTRLEDSGRYPANPMQILIYLETVALEDGMVRFFEAGPQFSNIFREKDWYRTKGATTQKMR